MKLPKQAMDDMMKNSPAADLLKNKKTIQSLANSPDAKKFMEVLRSQNGADLQSAASAAMKGDTTQLNHLLQDLMKNPEGAKAVQNLSQNLPK